MADHTYKYGKSWTRSEGAVYNGHGKEIREPSAYFEAVGENRYGYNSGYSNARGEFEWT